MRAALFMFALLACNSHNPSTTDAAMAFDAIDATIRIDAAIPIDTVPDSPPDAPSPDCPTYCAAIQANCTDANAQYADATACMTTCAAFAPGALVDTSGNTLGCRTFYAGTLSMTDPVVNCPHAGPAGDIISDNPGFCSGGNTCTSFCAIEIQGCGSLEAPLPGDPVDSRGLPLYQYRNMASCVSACAGLDKTHPYSTTSVGDSLACRLNEAVRATVSVAPDATTHCSSTLLNPRNSCAGTATP